MPLIQTYKTDLKSLRYGKDRPGGGSSKQPFHKVNYKKKFELGTEKLAQTGGPDLFIRGGSLLATRILADEERIGKYFLSTEGAGFWLQQNTLSALGARIYGGYPLLVTAENITRVNNGVYTPLSTLAAVLGNAEGYHPNKQGIDFTGRSPKNSLPQYINLVNLPNAEDGIRSLAKNRLVHLYENKIASLGGSQSTELYSYLGGPQAGKGGKSLKTIINTASSRTPYQGSGTIGFNGTPNIRFVGTEWFPLNYKTFDQGDIQALDYNPSNTYFVVGSGTTTNVQDFRKELLTPGTEAIISTSPNYKTKNLETRVNIGGANGSGAGARGANRRSYTTGRPDLPTGLDTLNSLYLYQSENVTLDKRKNDLVKFRIAVIDNDNPKQKTFAHFRSFIDSFSDDVSAEWNSFKYLGRGDNFYTYQGFTRTCNMSFTLMALSVQELSVMYQKLNYIISSLAPDYSSGGFMRGNLAQLTLGGYFYEMPGIINSINVTIPNDTTWEIAIPSDDTTIEQAGTGITFRNPNVQELPHRLQVTISFTPIPTFLPQIVGSGLSKTENAAGINGGGNIKQRFLSLADGNPNGKYNLYSKGVNESFKADQTNIQAQNAEDAYQQ